jgi:uncharacterized protein
MPGLPQFVEPERLADAGDSLAGSIELSALQRLGDLLDDRAGAVEFELHFSRNELGFPCIRGSFSTVLTMACQRCLKPLEMKLAQPIAVAVIGNASDAGRLMPDTEPLTLEDGRLHLAGFVEDAVLLGMPMAPVHETGACTPAVRQEPPPARENPFAVLKSLKEIKRRKPGV